MPHLPGYCSLWLHSVGLPANLEGLLAQVRAVFMSEEAKSSGAAVQGVIPSHHTLRELDVIHSRIESPAHRLERLLEPWSSFLILPLFALANAGVLFSGASINHDLYRHRCRAGNRQSHRGIVGACWLLVKKRPVRPAAGGGDPGCSRWALDCWPVSGLTHVDLYQQRSVCHRRTGGYCEDRSAECVYSGGSGRPGVALYDLATAGDED